MNMDEQDRKKRAYRSDRRQSQAQMTRLEIVAAARRLFERLGYSGATLEGIAGEAKVSLPTVYAAFGNKSQLLMAMARLTFGGGEDRSLLERDEPQAFFAETVSERLIPLLAEGISTFLSEISPVTEIVRSAGKADQTIAEFSQRVDAERWLAMERVAAHLRARKALRTDLSIPEAATIIGTLASPETFTLLTRSRAFSIADFRVWLEACLNRLL